MNSPTRFDVAILGAGPAGCVSALRLLSLGRSVALIERQAFPRPQVGESLSPGVRDLLAFVDAESVLDACPTVSGLPARVIWESPEARVIEPGERGPGLVVDRGSFDSRFASLAEARGAVLFQPARAARIEGELGTFRIPLFRPNMNSAVEARTIIDARGRSAGPGRDRINLGPPTHSLWAEFEVGLMHFEMAIEAMSNAWLWGSPLPDGGFRVMAFVDPARLRTGVDPSALFRSLLSASRLFAPLSTADFVARLSSRATTPYLSTEARLSGSIPVGERALALDPLSSSGVEKSMRSALTGVLAVHTMLESPDDSRAAEEFHFSRLLESAADHAVWTAGYYARAWPGSAQPFWRDRSVVTVYREHDARGVGEQLAHLMDLATNRWKDAERIRPRSPAPNLGSSVRLSDSLSFKPVPCAEGDFVKTRPAAMHPRLPRPIAYVGNVELIPLLERANKAETVADLLLSWTHLATPDKAISILRWLVENQILEISTTSGPD